MKTLIYIFGPSTSGKSTVSEILLKRIGDLVVVDFDVVKREIPGYDWKIHAQKGRHMTIAALESSVLSNSVLLLYPSAKDENEFKVIEDIARANNLKLLSIEITAPDEVLLERYRKRLKSLDPQKKDWKFKTAEEFEVKLREPYYKPPETISFDSSRTSSIDIAEQIIGHIE